MITVALVGCGKQKRAEASPARSLYVGDLFRKSAAFAAAHADTWHVLSALYGLVDPDTVIQPYDAVLGDKVTGPPIHKWAAKVVTQLATAYAGPINDGEALHIVMLAGRHYRTPLDYCLARENWFEGLDVPMAGLGIGQQKAWLIAHTPRERHVA